MAVPSNAFDTYESIGNREDLSDIIYDVSPSDTPFLSAIRKVSAKGTYHEWQTDALAAAGANAQVEGDDISGLAITPTVRLGNYCQIMSKSVTTTGTQEVINKAGRKSEMAYQMARKMKELKNDLEWAMIDGGGAGGIGNARAAGNASTAREMGSIQTYITTNTSFGAGGADPVTVDGAAVRTAGTLRNFDETQLTTVLQSAYTNGGDVKMLFVSPTNKGVASGFTGGGTHYVDKDDKKLVNAVDVYVGDFHTLTIVPSRHIANENVLAIDPEYVAYASLRGASTFDLSKTGDSLKKAIVMEGTLEVRNEKACCLIADTNG